MILRTVNKIKARFRVSDIFWPPEDNSIIGLLDSNQKIILCRSFETLSDNFSTLPHLSSMLNFMRRRFVFEYLINNKICYIANQDIFNCIFIFIVVSLVNNSEFIIT